MLNTCECYFCFTPSSFISTTQKQNTKRFLLVFHLIICFVVRWDFKFNFIICVFFIIIICVQQVYDWLWKNSSFCPEWFYDIFFLTYSLLIFVIWLWLFKNRDVSVFITRNSVVRSLKWSNRESLQGGNWLRSSLKSVLSGLSSPTISLSILLRTQLTCVSHEYPYIALVKALISLSTLSSNFQSLPSFL